MSLLTIVRDVCRRTGIPPPSGVVGSTDATVVQLYGLANEEGQELASRVRWQACMQHSVFKSKAQYNQGALQVLAPRGFGSVVSDTMWNLTNEGPIFGSIAAARWQLALSNKSGWRASGSWPGPYFRVYQNQLFITPAPAAGDDILFEYHSRCWALSVDGVVYRTAWAADDDVSLLDEDLMTAGLLWRWKQAKGLEYAEDFAKYERRVADATCRDIPSTVIEMDTGMPARSALFPVSISITPPPSDTIPPDTPPDQPPPDIPPPGDVALVLLNDLSVQMKVAPPATPSEDDVTTWAMVKALLQPTPPPGGQ